MQTFHHIRYAKAARFGEPVLVPFDESMLDDSTVVSCPQNKFRLGFIMGDGERTVQDEDCHFLSISTPSREGNRPVLVWIHGGAYIAGGGGESAYDGTALAEEGDIVVVSVTYRLGVFGYLYNPDGEPRNLGFKDQMAALKWLHENISRFGGDPSQVTLAGQSAGGYSVASLISCCKEPYFRKAIIQSAPLGFQFGEQYLKKQYRDFLDLLGKTVSEATTTDMLIAQKRLMEASGKSMCFSPYVPALGKGIACPSLERVLITWQKDDTSPFVAMRLKHENCFGGAIDRLATILSTWFVFKTMNRRYASFLKRNGIEVLMHELSWRPEGSKFGACHCLELSLLFGSWERWKGTGMLGQTDEAEWKKHSQELRKQWLQFIK
jgi:para-nitrobenzyl esterase